jgi:hypothetical protein
MAGLCEAKPEPWGPTRDEDYDKGEGTVRQTPVCQDVTLRIARKFMLTVRVIAVYRLQIKLSVSCPLNTP